MSLIIQNNKYRNTLRGFTILELLVTIGVFLLLSTVVLVNFRSVDSSLTLQNVAHQVALVVRKAQISGISVRGIDQGAGEKFPSYGVYFSLSDDTGFTLFADFNSNGVCTGNCAIGTEGIQRYSLPSGYSIQSLQGNGITGSTETPNKLNITFTRPNPDACFKKNPGGTSCPVGDYSDIEIIIQSKASATKTVTIWKTGQISIQ